MTTNSPSDRPINATCPQSGKPVNDDALTRYRGRTVGFCNPGCRDDFARARDAFDACIDGPGPSEEGAGKASASLSESWSPSEGGAADSGDLFDVLADEIRAAYADQREGPVAPSIPLNESAERVGEIDFDAPIGLTAALREAGALMHDGDLRSASARCFGYFNPTAALPGVVADALVSARNPQMCVVTHAPASVAMERRVVRWLLDQLGFPEGAVGNFTSGGSEANGTALQVALVRGNAGFAEDGVAAYDGPPRMYASADSHLAWVKIARAAGLGSGAVRLVPTDGHGRMDVGALRAAIAEDLSAGARPVMIAATAGTTNAGELDPLEACLEVASEHALHLHVDAAWAGALIVDPKRRGMLRGIERADSVTIDAHKWLAAPMGAGMVFLRDADAVARTFAVTTGYMPAGDGVDAYVTTTQWSRRFLGMRLWMMLRADGARAWAQLFERHFALAELLRGALAERGWRVRNESALPVVLFEDAREGLPAQELADALEADGQAWLGCVAFEGRDALRACMTSFLTEPRDVEVLLERLDVVRAGLVAAR